MEKSYTSEKVLLHQIADAIGLPIERLFNDKSTDGIVVDASECMRLWFKIRTPEGRLRALEALRMIAYEKAP